jgi:hypothetical protein
MKPFVPVFIFIIGAPLLIFFSAFYLFNLSVSSFHPPVPPNTNQVLGDETEIGGNYLFPLFLGNFGTADARARIIKNYLHKYSSPLEPFADKIINISDKYSLDYRLLVAIAQQESNLCKKIPEASHNCWGFGIYGDLVTRFDDYPTALDKVAKTLKREYVDKGLVTPEEIMAKYTPPSLEKGGPWAKGVSQFMTDLE